MTPDPATTRDWRLKCRSTSGSRGDARGRSPASGVDDDHADPAARDQEGVLRENWKSSAPARRLGDGERMFGVVFFVWMCV